MSRQRKKGLVSTLFIVVGILMLTVSVAYQTFYYPWGALLSSLGLVSAQELPDPDPIPASISVQKSSFSVMEQTEQRGELQNPNAMGSFFAQRPALDITAVGSIKLPSIGIAENLVEGGGDELFYGVGLIPGSALPGEKGNCVLAGHRNYYTMHPFRHLDKLENGDDVIVKYDSQEYRYVVIDSFVAKADNLSVLAAQDGEDELLTLVTCTPVLNPTNRLIVWCRPAD